MHDGSKIVAVLAYLVDHADVQRGGPRLLLINHITRRAASSGTASGNPGTCLRLGDLCVYGQSLRACICPLQLPTGLVV